MPNDTFLGDICMALGLSFLLVGFFGCQPETPRTLPPPPSVQTGE
jgi:hypothetical protein